MYCDPTTQAGDFAHLAIMALPSKRFLASTHIYVWSHTLNVVYSLAHAYTLHLQAMELSGMSMHRPADRCVIHRGAPWHPTHASHRATHCQRRTTCTWPETGWEYTNLDAWAHRSKDRRADFLIEKTQAEWWGMKRKEQKGCNYGK